MKIIIIGQAIYPAGVKIIIIGQAIYPAIHESLKMKSATHKNTYDLDSLQQHERRKNLRLNCIVEEEGEN